MMQYSPIDRAVYYDGQFLSRKMTWSGLYDKNAEKFLGYYAFYFLRQLYEQGH